MNGNDLNGSVRKPDLTLYLPLPPSVNGLYKNIGKRGRAKTDKYLMWEADAYEAILKQKRFRVRGMLEVHYTYVFPDDRARDVFNYEKALSDFLTKCGIFEDDSMIKKGVVEWVEDGVGVKVEIFCLTP